MKRIRASATMKLDRATRRRAAQRWRTSCRRARTAPTAMENALQKCPDVNLVYTINEPAAAGAWEALKGAGKADGSVLIVSIDGGCPGVKNVNFFFSSRRRHTRCLSDWSSDVCSSD